MKHTHKVKLARKMLTPKEAKDGVSKFLSKAWLKRKEARLLKVVKK